MPIGPQEALRYAADVCRAPARAVSRWKAASGGKAVGCLPLYLPEEILHAAGMLPVTVWGIEFASAGAECSPPFVCSTAGAVVAALRTGTWGCLDAWAVPSACEALRSEFEASIPPQEGCLSQFSFVFPASGDAPGAAEDLLDRMEAFREWAAAVSGRPVSEGSLDRSVRAYNENRRTYALLEQRMAESPGWASAREYQALAGAGMILPAEAYTAILRAALSRARATGGKPRAKVFVSGLTAAGPVLDALDAAGAAIVGNDLVFGHRYYCCGAADEHGDMCVSLVRRHLRLGPPPGLHGGFPVDRVLERFASCGAGRMLALRSECCKAGSAGIPEAEAHFRKRGIPFLSVDVAAPADPPTLAARIEAFVDMR